MIEQGNIVVLEAATKGTFTGPMATPEGEVPPAGLSYVALFSPSANSPTPA